MDAPVGLGETCGDFGKRVATSGLYRTHGECRGDERTPGKADVFALFTPQRRDPSANYRNEGEQRPIQVVKPDQWPPGHPVADQKHHKPEHRLQHQNIFGPVLRRPKRDRGVPSPHQPQRQAPHHQEQKQRDDDCTDDAMNACHSATFDDTP